jgi:hypothetical protein
MRDFVLLLLLGACEPPPQLQTTHVPAARRVVCASGLDAAVTACTQALYSDDQELLKELRWQQRLHELELRRQWRAKHLWDRD